LSEPKKIQLEPKRFTESLQKIDKVRIARYI